MVKLVTPRDTGLISDDQLPSDDGGWGEAEAFAPTLQSGGDIGQALRAIRESRRLSLDEVAEATRVRRAYLEDLEAMRLERLPSRPFTMGYIKAYAEALGLDGEAAVERFKAEEPDLDEPLRAPVGVSGEKDPRVAAIVAAVAVIVVAIILWNIAQRTMLAGAPPPPTASARSAALALSAPPPPVFKLGVPLPAPVESTTPPLYHTPGMPDDGQPANLSAAGNKLAVKPDGEPAIDPATLPPIFVPNGKVYGAAAGQTSSVTLQALKSASLIVRGTDGSIYFARQFAPGEAFRAPWVSGLIAEVSEPTNFQVFVNGQSKGVLPAAQTSLTQLAQGGAVVQKVASAAAPASGAARPAAATTVRPSAAKPVGATPSAAMPKPAVAKPAPAPDEAPH
jgi:transcriptional regulator with XRE-family HTH domain